QHLEAGYKRYYEILKNLQEGAKFYEGFRKPLNDFKDECFKFARNRKAAVDEQLDMLKLATTMSSVSVSPIPPNVTPGEWQPSMGIAFKDNTANQARPPAPGGAWTASHGLQFDKSEGR
ncbi:3578_t:CDS:2, partial [Paraglomus occultum]